MDTQEICLSNSSQCHISQTGLLILFKHIDDTFHLHYYWNFYITVFIVLVACGSLYYILFIPSNHIYVFGDLGFCHVSKDKNRQQKADLVNAIRRRKALGDLPPVYPNGWYVLAESPDVKAGQVKHIQALGENFAVMRTTAGQVHVLDAYCPHLGANMAVGGVVRGDCLECPFHGWQFRGEDGVCSHIPYSDKVPKSARVKIWHSSEDVSENGADLAHFTSIHGNGIQAGGETWTRSSHLRRTVLQHVWTPRWEKVPGVGQEHKCKGSMVVTTKLFGKYKLIQGTTVFTEVGPGIYINGKSPMVQIITFIPIEPLLIRAVFQCYSTLLYLPLSKLMLKYGIPFVVKRDALMWTHKKYMNQPQLCQEEAPILMHRRWFKQFYSASSPRISPQQNSLAW